MKNHSASIFIPIAFFAVFLFAPKLSFAESNLVINEIMYDASGTDDKHEWVELQNAGSSEIDLADWKFNDGDGPTNHALNIPPQNGSRGSLIIPAGGYIILSGNASTTILDLPNYTGSIIDTVMSLNNTGATLKILDKDGAQIASASYSKEMGATGNGKTLSRDGLAFKESQSDGGTPGRENDFSSQSDTPTPPDPLATPDSSSSDFPSQTASSSQSSFNNFSDKIFINEFMPWPPSEQKEWVELINTGEETIDLSNWQIDDEPEESKEQTIPGGTLIEPGKYLTIALNKNILNNEGDQLRLLWPDGQTVHAVTFKSAKQGFSSSRFENGLWLWTDIETPSQENKKPAAKSTPISQTQSSQAQPAGQPKINPLIETAQINVVPQKSSQPAQKPTPPVNPSPDALNDSDSPDLPDSSNLSAAAASPLQNQINTKTSSSKIILPLAAILFLSIAASLGLIYFKRKKSNDPVKKLF